MTTRTLRLSDAIFPESLDLALKELGSAVTWITATAILEDAELRVFDPKAGKLGAPRRIAGRIEAVSLAGPVAQKNGAASSDVRSDVRVVLSRETDTGVETFAGHLVSAVILSLEGVAHGAPEAEPAAHAPVAAGAPNSAPKTSWSDAVNASAASTTSSPRDEVIAERVPAPRPSAPAAPAPSAPSAPIVSATQSSGESAPMPRPPARIARPETDEVYPDAGDLADHFAFGRCEVVTSDGDRLHLRIPRDGRIKEIALEMLKVSRREDENGKRVYKLDRKM